MNASLDLAELESCLATRVNYENVLESKRMKAISRIENFIIESCNDYHVRCRVDDDDHVRIEFSSEETFKKLSEKKFRKEIYEMGKEIALFVTVDLKFSRPNEYDKRIKI